MEVLRRPRAVDEVVDQLRHAILTGEIRPGEPIRVQRLEEEFGFSHIPIREGLHQLEAEGLVVIPPRRKPVVADVTIEELSAVYELRRMVELPTARLAVTHSSPADVQRVHESFRCLERSAAEPESREYWERHRHLHWAMITAGANVWTQRVLAPLWRASERYVRLFVTEFGSVGEAERMHRDLVEAYEHGDPDTFADALADHFTETEQVVKDGFLPTMKP